MASATVEETRRAIDDALRSRGTPYNNYSCKQVSWDDVSRGEVGGSLSCWGANITDTYLKGKDGSSLYTVRADNWNERLGYVRAADVALLHGNCRRRNASSNGSENLTNITLKQFLQQPCANGAGYTGLDNDLLLYNDKADEKVSIRFQTVFLPVAASQSSEKRQTFEFATEAYNYNTTSDDDPRNLVVLATTQGVAVQTDGAGTKRVLHHAYDTSRGEVRKFWLEAERSDHGVGGAQVESAAEREDAVRRGKAISRELGIAAMGTRFNTLMTIQIPLKPKRKPAVPLYPYSTSASFGVSPGMFIPPSMGLSKPKATRMRHAVQRNGAVMTPPWCNAPSAPMAAPVAGGFVKSDKRYLKRFAVPKMKKRGTANAARVSRGSDAGPVQPLSVHEPTRNPAEHVTVTVVFYNTVAGGVPTPEDVVLAVDDMEELLKACSTDGRLADQSFSFMKKKLTVDDVSAIETKLTTQPPGSGLPKETAEEQKHEKKNEKKKKLVLDKIETLKNIHTQENITEARLVTVGVLHELKCTPDAIAVVTKSFEKFASHCSGSSVNDSSANGESVSDRVELLRVAVCGALFNQ